MKDVRKKIREEDILDKKREVVSAKNVL